MRFKPITITDKELFEDYLSQRPQPLITYNFTSFYLWKDWDPYSWLELDGALCVKSDYFEWDAVLPPFSGDDQAVLSATERLIAWYEKRGVPFLMAEVSEDKRALYEKYWPGRFLAEEFPDGANYIYRQEDLAWLHGRKFSDKRNHISAFRREHSNFSLEPLTAELLAPCRDYLESWYQTHGTSEDLIWERFGIMGALQQFGQLDYQGAVLLINGHIRAFTMGNRLSDDTYAVQVEKADPQVRGLYPLINQLFVQQYCADYPFINRAEDMGEPGLRKAKLSYNPCKMAKKYHLTLNREGS